MSICDLTAVVHGANRNSEHVNMLRIRSFSWKKGWNKLHEKSIYVGENVHLTLRINLMSYKPAVSQYNYTDSGYSLIALPSAHDRRGGAN